jgi:signal transduction histidine kinase
MGQLLNTTVGMRARVQFDLAQDLWLAFVDPGQIEHAIMNLVINAGDAITEDGTISIATMNVQLPDAGCDSKLPPGDYVLISVADTGCGMPDDI